MSGKEEKHDKEKDAAAAARAEKEDKKPEKAEDPGAKGGHGPAAEAGARAAAATLPAAAFPGRKGMLIVVALFAVQTATFLFLLMRQPSSPDNAKEAQAMQGGHGESEGEAHGDAGGGHEDPGGHGPELDSEAIHAIEPWIIDLDEMTVYPQSSNSNAPYRITSRISVALSKQLGDGLHAGAKDTPMVKLIKLNVKQVLNQMLEEYGVRILDFSAREAFQQEAKAKLNNAQVEGDRDMQRVMRVLRGHVRQVMFKGVEKSNF
jgi:hypothetical protein